MQVRLVNAMLNRIAGENIFWRAKKNRPKAVGGSFLVD
jgi:hypothetical protein